MTVMLKYGLLLALLASVSVDASRKIQPGRASASSASMRASVDPSMVDRSRLFLQKSTLTITNYLSTSAVCTTTRKCATSTAALTACRRRRDAIESHIVHDDAISPSEPDAVEVTAAPEWHPSPHHSGLMGSVDEPMEAVVTGLGSCISGRNLGITILFTTTVTSSTLCQSSTTETKQFTISGCSPTGITFC